MRRSFPRSIRKFPALSSCLKSLLVYYCCCCCGFCVFFDSCIVDRGARPSSFPPEHFSNEPTRISYIIIIIIFRHDLLHYFSHIISPKRNSLDSGPLNVDYARVLVRRRAVRAVSRNDTYESGIPREKNPFTVMLPFHNKS